MEIGSVAAIVSAIVAVVSAALAARAAATAKRAADTGSFAYRLNAAKEWADRASGIQHEFMLATYAHNDLCAEMGTYFARSGGLNSSAHQGFENKVKLAFTGAQTVCSSYEFDRVPPRVLDACTSTQFAGLVADLENDRARVKAMRIRLENLRDSIRK